MDVFITLGFTFYLEVINNKMPLSPEPKRKRPWRIFLAEMQTLCGKMDTAVGESHPHHQRREDRRSDKNNNPAPE